MELPLLEKQYQQQIVEDRAFHEQQEEERVATEIKDRKEKEENRERMGQMESSGEEFLDIVQSERHEAHLVNLSRELLSLTPPPPSPPPSPSGFRWS